MAGDGYDFFAVSADLGVASGFSRFMKEYPEHYVNVGIAEQNLISVAAGMANENLPVIATSWGAFASYRCADQIRVLLGLMGSNVKIIGMGSGMAISRFGGSHYGIGDIALLRAIPGLTVIAPSDGIEIYYSIYEAMRTKNPTYIRLTGGERLPIINSDLQYHFEIGKANILSEGEDVFLIACGSLLDECIKAGELLKDRGITTTILNMHTIKPFDTESVLKGLNHKLIVTVEEHNVIGGLGAAVAETLAGVSERPKHLLLGMNDFVPKAGDYQYLLKVCQLSAYQIADRIDEALRK
ncbi:MAG: transketolase [Lachnospiraceae bacterium]|nr:transketolase [Lachnospiraceae bacterium]